MGEVASTPSCAAENLAADDQAAADAAQTADVGRNRVGPQAQLGADGM